MTTLSSLLRSSQHSPLRFLALFSAWIVLSTQTLWGHTTVPWLPLTEILLASALWFFFLFLPSVEECAGIGDGTVRRRVVGFNVAVFLMMVILILYSLICFGVHTVYIRMNGGDAVHPWHYMYIVVFLLLVLHSQDRKRSAVRDMVLGGCGQKRTR